MNSFNPDEDFVPKHSQKVYECAFRNTPYYEQWIFYSRMMQGNPYVKEFLARRQEGKCLYCGKALFEDMNYNIVHHRDYMNLCVQHDSKASLVRYPKPTRRNPNKTILVPNCTYCKRHTTDDFNDCMNRVVIMHDDCHTKLHYSEQKLSEWKPVKFVRWPKEIRSQNPITANKNIKKIRKTPLCKRCGIEMELRDGKYGLFFGCINYPDCRYTENL